MICPLIYIGFHWFTLRINEFWQFWQPVRNFELIDLNEFSTDLLNYFFKVNLHVSEITEKLHRRCLNNGKHLKTNILLFSPLYFWHPVCTYLGAERSPISRSAICWQKTSGVPREIFHSEMFCAPGQGIAI